MKKSEVRRLKERASYDLDELFSFLNKTHFVTVSFIQKETIFSIPMLHAVYNEKIYLHAAVGSRITKELTNNASVTLSATDVHGIVLSKSLFNSSMNYQSAVVFGETKRIDDEEIMYAAFENMVDRFFKGRFEDARKPTKNEWLQTAMLEFTINEFSLKQRTGMPKEEESDKTLPIWSGVVPLKSEFVEPEPDLEHSKGIELPDYLKFT
ncbi:MAG: pyridoxamine 5'-phosphate oxidase family protein [Wenyingzhuangia sp.]|uniref:pyridoxamine 5'-phosphate oxidase family protein n=1 Tax=Wenyingzhuangia sp. TaxID=1964193 RepID=UPI00321A275A